MFGIVDGLHSNKDLRSILSNKHTSKDMKWFVTKFTEGVPIESSCQLARFQNHREYQKYYVSLALFDEIQNLREKYEQLSRTSSSVTNVAVARTTFGQESVSRTMTILASMPI